MGCTDHVETTSKIGRVVMTALMGLFAASVTSSAIAAYSYKMLATITMPNGSAGASLATTQPSNTKFTPCTAGKLDAVTFTITYDAGKVAGTDLKDVYVILRSPSSVFYPDGILYTLTRNALGGGISFTGRANAAALTSAKATDIYLKTTDNPGIGSITDTIIASFISVDGVATGTWQLIGIIADSATVDFDNPSTWAAWDIATVVFSQPWTGSTIRQCA